MPSLEKRPIHSNESPETHPGLLDLLTEFLTSENAARPIVRVLADSALPQPYRDLLAHARDMTSTLTNFHKEPLWVHPLRSKRKGDVYSREVTLYGAQSGKIHEFGAIRIHLSQLPEIAQKVVLEEKKPFGGILNALEIDYRSAPSAYFEIDPSEEIVKAMGLKTAERLFGRCNTLSSPDGRLFAEIVEILPPATPSAC